MREMPAMRPETQPSQTPTRLADYRPPAWIAETVRLVFDLHDSATRVRATVTFAKGTGGDLRLDGRKLTLVAAGVDGADVTDRVETDREGLTLRGPLPDRFEWTCETEIDPASNTELEGLYLSNAMFCTQCEAEGFRKITYWPDRPDVMATFDVRIEADLPVLLSNGNPGQAGTLPDGRRFAEWHDPHPKPSYLFALVAGDLVAHEDSFTTASGREVDLKIWVRKGDEDKCAYAMDALKRSMRWDEEAYGREYDLDLFQIVAVDDFNMGAMENKGLNIFNSRYVLASPETATDANYASIEAIIAHEYFHNWTGNRITCRDWFQLCLKEGLTVFRDQQFSQDMRSAPVQRLHQVDRLRSAQFREDDGPLAHPVRPVEYVEINNFYTTTVYEKGAEVIRMLHTLIGADAYRKGTDLYFDRHDGQACTIEDWLKVFEDATGRDLSQFALWYHQAGTPRLSMTEDWDETDGVWTLTVTQTIPDTPGQTDKAPHVIPVALGLIGPDGAELLPTEILEVTKPEQIFRFSGLPARPVPSYLRGFSAPVILARETTNAERALLLAHDTDPFNRYEAGRTFGLSVARAVMAGAEVDPAWLDALGAVLADPNLDAELKGMSIQVPRQTELASAIGTDGETVDPDAIQTAVLTLRRTVGETLRAPLAETYAGLTAKGGYTPDPAAAARRFLRNECLHLLAAAGEHDRADAQFADADNMTDSFSALTALVMNRAPTAADRLAAFHDRWQADTLVLDKWLGLQASAPDALDNVKALTTHPSFIWQNPNKFRALVGMFAMANPTGFHRTDGAGYNFVADWLLKLDPVNPQTAARLAGCFETWRRYDANRQTLMRAEMERLLAADLSRNTREIVGRMLGT